MTTDSAFFAPGLLDGRTVFITGGATGIGRGIAETLGDLGARIFMASRDEERLSAAVGELAGRGIAADYLPADVRDYARVEAAVEACVARFGALDILINNAAGIFICPTAELSPNGWKTVIDIDLNGTFHCCKAAFPHLRDARGGGRIVSITTTHARSGWPGAAHAAAAKAGIQSLTRTLAVEWAPYGILANCVAPGPIAGTVGVDKLYVETGREVELISHVPLARLGRVEEIGNAVAYLCSRAADYVTGAELVVDGGRQWTPARG